MEARLPLVEIWKPFAMVFTVAFILRKLFCPIPPELKMNAKSAGISQGTGSAKRT